MERRQNTFDVKEISRSWKGLIQCNCWVNLRLPGNKIAENAISTLRTRWFHETKIRFKGLRWSVLLPAGSGSEPSSPAVPVGGQSAWLFVNKEQYRTSPDLRAFVEKSLDHAGAIQPCPTANSCQLWAGAVVSLPRAGHARQSAQIPGARWTVGHHAGACQLKLRPEMRR